MNSEEVTEIFKKTGALLEGHFILTSGFHSPQYFQCAKVLQFPEYNSFFAKAIIEKFGVDGINKKIDVVIAPAVGGIVLATEIGRQLNVRTIFAERENGVMNLRRGFEIHEDENVLVCEDVVTTGGSVMEVIDLVKSRKAFVAGVGFIIDRSGGKINFGTEQHSLAKIDVIKFSEDEIPEWLQRIPVTKPGSRSLK